MTTRKERATLRTLIAACDPLTLRHIKMLHAELGTCLDVAVHTGLTPPEVAAALREAGVKLGRDKQAATRSEQLAAIRELTHLTAREVALTTGLTLIRVRELCSRYAITLASGRRGPRGPRPPCPDADELRDAVARWGYKGTAEEYETTVYRVKAWLAEIGEAV